MPTQSILETIIAEKRVEVTTLREEFDLDSIKANVASLPAPRGFVKSLITSPAPAIIAEVKRASPSKGIIREDLEPHITAAAYVRGGAACISVLTDYSFFQGKLQFISQINEHCSDSCVPILRKDFIIDPAQIWQTRQVGADALLLIVAALSEQELESFNAGNVGC